MQGAAVIDTLYRDHLAPLPKSESGEKLVRRYHERYHWPLALALIFLVVEMLMPERKSPRSRGSSRSDVDRLSLSEPRRAAVNSGRNGRSQPGRERNLAVTTAAMLVLLAFIPATAGASPSSALREYNAGKYDQSLKEYEKLLEKKKDDPRLHFNAGAAAYQSKQFDEAQKQFDQALNSPDLEMLEKAYYNRGNTLYQLGALNPDPEKRKKAWEDALNDFDSAKRLNEQDADAKHNYDFVRKRLEELKQQQQNQQSNKDNKKDQKQDQGQNQQNQQAKNDQDKDKKSEQDKSQQGKEDQQKDQQQKNEQAQNEKQGPKGQDQQKKEQQQASNQQKDQKPDQKQNQQQPNAAKGKPGEKGDEEKTYAVGQMTPQQAQQLLDAQKNEEMLLPVRPDGKVRERSGPKKDW